MKKLFPIFCAVSLFLIVTSAKASDTPAGCAIKVDVVADGQGITKATVNGIVGLCGKADAKVIITHVLNSIEPKTTVTVQGNSGSINTSSKKAPAYDEGAQVQAEGVCSIIVAVAVNEHGKVNATVGGLTGLCENVNAKTMIIHVLKSIDASATVKIADGNKSGFIMLPVARDSKPTEKKREYGTKAKGV